MCLYPTNTHKKERAPWPQVAQAANPTLFRQAMVIYTRVTVHSLVFMSVGELSKSRRKSS